MENGHTPRVLLQMMTLWYRATDRERNAFASVCVEPHQKATLDGVKRVWIKPHEKSVASGSMLTVLQVKGHYRRVCSDAS